VLGGDGLRRRGVDAGLVGDRGVLSVDGGLLLLRGRRIGHRVGGARDDGGAGGEPDESGASCSSHGVLLSFGSRAPGGVSRADARAVRSLSR